MNVMGWQSRTAATTFRLWQRLIRRATMHLIGCNHSSVEGRTAMLEAAQASTRLPRFTSCSTASTTAVVLPAQ